jgi:NDP-sugar pyrophosphorylase family protein
MHSAVPQPATKIDIPAIVLCGGKSSRMAERTQNKVPKHLLGVGGKRIIDHVIEPFVAAPKIILATGVHGEKVAAHAKATHPKLPIALSHRETPQGVIAAIHDAVEEHAVVGSFMITSGDEVISGLNVAEFLSDHRLSQKAASLVVSSQIKTVPDFGFMFDEKHNATNLARNHESAIAEARHYGSGTFVLHTDTLPLMREQPSWEQFVRTMIDQQALHCHVTDQPFFNLNTPEELALFEQTVTPLSA